MDYSKISSDEIFEQTLGVVAPLPCQEAYLRQLSSILSFHIHRNQLMDEGYLTDDLPQMSAMVVAPTGQGKTFLLRKMAEVAGINLIIVDCSTLAAEGWKGVSLGQRLYTAQKATEDQEAFDRSVLFLDEVDKLRLWGTNSDQGNPVSNILQLYNSGCVAAEASGKGSVNIDIKRFTVLLGGAFEGIDEIIRKRLSPQCTIGFDRGVESKQLTSAERILRVTKDDLVAYGMLPELLGRIGTILTIPPLSKEDYQQLLRGANGSLQYQYRNYLRGLYGVSFTLTDTAANCIAEMCLKSGSGTRAVTPIVNDYMRDAISAVERDNSVNRICLDANEKDLYIRYDYGERIYYYKESGSEELPVLWIKAKTCKALAEKLCRYYRKSGGDVVFLPKLRSFLECTLEYLERNVGGQDFSYSSLEKLARTTQRKHNISRFEMMICNHKSKSFQQFRDAYTDNIQRDLVMALQQIMVYLVQYHKKVEIKFELKK